MIRTRALVMAVALAGAGTVGCTFCDTCDDFPIPVTGGAGYTDVNSSTMMVPPPVAEGSFTGQPAAAGDEAAPPSETESPFSNPETPEGQPPAGDPAAEMEANPGEMPAEGPEASPPAPGAPEPESSVPLPGTAPESLPGTVPSPEPEIPASALPGPGAPAAPSPG